MNAVDDTHGEPVKRQIALTIDDLPWGPPRDHRCEYRALLRMTRRLAGVIALQSVPVTAFFIGDNCSWLSPKEKRELLLVWLAAGAELGNHTWSHCSLNDTAIDLYEEEILRTHRELIALGVNTPRYFRCPRLHTGMTEDDRSRLECFLAKIGYTHAPVTVNTSDWMFSDVHNIAMEQRRKKIVADVRTAYIRYVDNVTTFVEGQSLALCGRSFPQVLLIHANTLNAIVLSDLLALLRQRGYELISLTSALVDDVYQIPNVYVGPKGLSWVHRWSIARGIPIQGEPVRPDWILSAFHR